MLHAPIRAAALAAVALACAFSGAAQAEIYKWTDAQGVVNYSNLRPGEASAARVVASDNLSVVAPVSRVTAADAELLSERLAERQRADDRARASASESATLEPLPPSNYDEPYYYSAGELGYPPLIRRAARRGGDYDRLQPGPYGIGAQAAPAPVRYRDLPRSRMTREDDRR